MKKTIAELEAALAEMEQVQRCHEVSLAKHLKERDIARGELEKQIARADASQKSVDYYKSVVADKQKQISELERDLSDAHLKLTQERERAKELDRRIDEQCVVICQQQDKVRAARKDEEACHEANRRLQYEVARLKGHHDDDLLAYQGARKKQDEIIAELRADLAKTTLILNETANERDRARAEAHKYDNARRLLLEEMKLHKQRVAELTDANNELHQKLAEVRRERDMRSAECFKLLESNSNLAQKHHDLLREQTLGTKAAWAAYTQEQRGPMSDLFDPKQPKDEALRSTIKDVAQEVKRQLEQLYPGATIQVEHKIEVADVDEDELELDDEDEDEMCSDDPFSDDDDADYTTVAIKELSDLQDKAEELLRYKALFGQTRTCLRQMAQEENSPSLTLASRFLDLAEYMANNLKPLGS